ncbi:MAG TPA: hypothetical protein VLA46_00045, partial [Saprospiraceae bacterium]|nr:hypothetical protein [Saprospiraceae bacterium]
MKGYIFCLFLFSISCLYGQDTIHMPLSGTMIHLVSFGQDSSPVLLYNMHDNENSSAMAGRILSWNKGGRYYELMHNGKRNISFLF